MNNRLAEEEIAQLRTEAQNLANLRHPQIVRILDFGLEETVPFLVMDYASNGTLCKKHPLKLNDTQRLY
jgi:serine/threonine protein kinase